MKIELTSRGQARVLSMEGCLVGEVDGDRLSDTLRQCLDEGYRGIVLDMGRIRMVNSLGLGVLFQSHRLCAAAGVELNVVNVPARVAMLLRVTQLDRVLKSNVDEAA